MSDYISRQAAIEIIKNYCENGCDYAEDNWCPSCQREKFVELLKALPSAQQWIPCSERAPSELQECWLTGIDGMVYQGTFTRRHGERRDSGFICNGFQFAFLNAVVAWMPYEAPKAYKGEES